MLMKRTMRKIGTDFFQICKKNVSPRIMVGIACGLNEVRWG